MALRVIKCVTNSYRLPFHVYSDGQDPFRRWGSTINVRDSGSILFWGTPLLQMTRITSAFSRLPRPAWVVGPSTSNDW